MLITTPLHLGWEVLHVRWYTLWYEGDAFAVAYGVLHCTAGDALIAGTTFLIAAVVTGRLDWPQRASVLGIATLLLTGMVYTAMSEWINVYALQRWAYTPAMPTIAGLGVTPLLQWLVVPLLGLWWYRSWMRQRT